MNESQHKKNDKSAEKAVKTEPPSNNKNQKNDNPAKTTVNTDPASNIFPEENITSDDLAILSVYVNILSSVIGLASLYLAKAEKARENAQAEPTVVGGVATAPVGVLRNKSNVHKKKRKMKKSRP
ncbi:hypothetical protein [Paenibacillus marinisediminis]